MVPSFLNDRQLLTVTVGGVLGVLTMAPPDSTTASVFTKSVKFVSSNNIDHVVILSLLVYNRTTQKIEPLIQSLGPTISICIDYSNYKDNGNGFTSIGLMPDPVSFNPNPNPAPPDWGLCVPAIITPDNRITFQWSAYNILFSIYLQYDSPSHLIGCGDDNFECWDRTPPSHPVSYSSVMVVNCVSLPPVGVVISDSTLCCYADGDLVEFIVNLAVPFVIANYTNYSSLEACQQVDTVCTCPSNTTCWLYNGVNVPCCIQANPSDDRFKVNKILNTKITQSPTDCQAEATTCVNWRFNTKDVPCCIQRSTDQWNTMGYDLATTQQYSTEELCRTANTNCTFYTLLHPAKLKTTDFNNLIFESKFTSGCETLRDANVSNPFGSSLDCTKDVNKTECISGNCGKNFCDAWSPSSVTPVNAYSFTQNVNCLPESSVCTGNKTLNVTNAGKWNVSSICQ
jgi:hypothetical protein